MTQKEMTRLRVINQTIDKIITIREAAELLNLSERQVIRLKKGGFERRTCVHHPQKQRSKAPACSLWMNLKTPSLTLKKRKIL